MVKDVLDAVMSLVLKQVCECASKRSLKNKIKVSSWAQILSRYAKHLRVLRKIHKPVCFASHHRYIRGVPDKRAVNQGYLCWVRHRVRVNLPKVEAEVLLNFIALYILTTHVRVAKRDIEVIYGQV